MISTSTVILRSGILPHWLGIVGYLMALPMFLLPLITQPLGLGFPIWVFLVSVVILAKRLGAATPQS